MDIQKIYDARERLKGHIKETPVVKAQNLGDDIYLKVEVLQDTGSFKLRGAYNKIATLTEEEASRGVIACSAGNHAQGVAKSATERGIKSLICMPLHAPISKVEATQNYGGEVLLVPETFDDAKAKAEELVREKGYTLIAPFDDEEVIAGQGTIGLEIAEQLPDVDIVVVPIGGGGLIAGVSQAIKKEKPNVKVIGVQTKAIPSMYESKKEGKVTTVAGGSTIADGIAVKVPGNITFDIVKEYVDEIVLVDEQEIASAILTLLEKDKIVTEGAGATPVAAVMYDKFEHKGKKVCCVLSGGNIDVTRIQKVIDKGLFKSGRAAEYDVVLNDIPGEMTKLTKIFEEEKANISHIRQKIDAHTDAIDAVIVNVVVSTRNEKHQEEIENVLKEKGYNFTKR